MYDKTFKHFAISFIAIIGASLALFIIVGVGHF